MKYGSNKSPSHGEVQDLGKTHRFVYATPYKMNLPKYEPLPGEAICEKAAQRPQLANAR